MLSDMALIELQAATLFRHDASGRMLCLNESSPGPAPRLFLGRTRTGNVWRFGHAVPAPLVSDLDRLLRTEAVATNLNRPPGVLPDLIDVLQAEAAVERIWMGPAWRFPDELESREGVVAIHDSNTEVLHRHYSWVIAELEDVQPCTAVIAGGDAVSLCFCSRKSPEAAEAGVKTVEAFRGRGYATTVVAAWAGAVRESRRVPLYSTPWDNLASRSVASKLGLVLYGADLWIK